MQVKISQYIISEIGYFEKSAYYVYNKVYNLHLNILSELLNVDYLMYQQTQVCR